MCYIITEWFFLYIRLLVQVHRHWVQFMLVHWGYDYHNCHNKLQIGNETGVWMTSCQEALGKEFGYFEKHVSWRQDASGRQRALGPQWPTVEQPSQDEKEVLLGKYSSLSLSPAHLSHTTNITLSRIKCERLNFYKGVYSFVHRSPDIMFDYVPHIFVYVCGYTTKGKKDKRKKKERMEEVMKEVIEGRKKQKGMNEVRKEYEKEGKKK